MSHHKPQPTLGTKGGKQINARQAYWQALFLKQGDNTAKHDWKKHDNRRQDKTVMKRLLVKTTKPPKIVKSPRPLP